MLLPCWFGEALAQEENGNRPMQIFKKWALSRYPGYADRGRSH
jgi:hypothetical protein